MAKSADHPLIHETDNPPSRGAKVEVMQKRCKCHQPESLKWGSAEKVKRLWKSRKEGKFVGGLVGEWETWRDGKIKGMHHWYIPFIVYSFNTLCYHHTTEGRRTRLLVDRVYTYPGLSTGNPPVGTTISIVACVPTVDGAAISIFNAQFIDSAFIGKAI